LRPADPTGLEPTNKLAATVPSFRYRGANACANGAMHPRDMTSAIDSFIVPTNFSVDDARLDSCPGDGGSSTASQGRLS